MATSGSSGPVGPAVSARAPTLRRAALRDVRNLTGLGGLAQPLVRRAVPGEELHAGGRVDDCRVVGTATATQALGNKKPASASTQDIRNG